MLCSLVSFASNPTVKVAKSIENEKATVEKIHDGLFVSLKPVSAAIRLDLLFDESLGDQLIVYLYKDHVETVAVAFQVEGSHEAVLFICLVLID